MDYLGYLASNKFILVIADTRFRVKAGTIEYKTDRARKVYQLNDHTLLSVVGDLHKTNDVRTYLTEICRLRPDESFDELLEHLKSVFDRNSNLSTDELRTVSDLLKQHIDEDDELNMAGFMRSLNNKPELMPFVTEALGMISNGMRYPTTALLIGVESEHKALRAAKQFVVGDMIRGGEVLPMEPDNFAFEFISSSHSPSEQGQISQAMIEVIRKYIVEDWENSDSATATLKAAAKHCLKLGMSQLNPHTDPAQDTDFVYYEISSETNYRISGPLPDRELIDVAINRPDVSIG